MCHHLKYEDRCQISALVNSGTSKSFVAAQLGVHRSTITRELIRNNGKDGYHYQEAEKLAFERREKASSTPHKMCGELYKHLRHHGKKYNKRKGNNAGRGLIPNRVDIDQRPAIVEEKTRTGDWEGDTIKVYFAKPYHSWERGLNEHTNGLVRANISQKKRVLIY